MKRIVCIFLVLTMLLSLLSSCVGEKPKDDTPPEQTKTEWSDLVGTYRMKTLNRVFANRESDLTESRESYLVLTNGSDGWFYWKEDGNDGLLYHVTVQPICDAYSGEYCSVHVGFNSDAMDLSIAVDGGAPSEVLLTMKVDAFRWNDRISVPGTTSWAFERVDSHPNSSYLTAKVGKLTVIESEVLQALKGKIDDPYHYIGAVLTPAKLQYASAHIKKKADYALANGFTNHFPSHASVNNVYVAEDNDKVGGWNQGFWTGILWHLYELTGDEKYATVCNDYQVPTFLKRIETKFGVNHHDMGFLFTPSCVASYQLTGNEDAKRAALLAADHLISRYHEGAGFIQAWGNVNDPADFRLIADCLMNIPLLYWASEVTGDDKYFDIAYNHFLTTESVIIREDGSTFHTYYFDPETNLPSRGVTHQGASDDSAWSRGQAWSMYGSILSYSYTRDPKAMEMFKRTTNYYLNHLPADDIPYWDMSFTDGDDEPRDSSAAAIALCAMLEGLKYMDESDPLYAVYTGAVNRMMNSLIDNYLTANLPQANGFLLHATYGKPQNNGVDEMNIWGDYFFAEAIHRLILPEWDMYW